MDNTGKTTLARQLENELHLVHLVSDGPHITKEQMEENLRILFSIPDFIQERLCFFEEMVYGKILRGNSKFNFRSPVFKIIKKERPTIIYCRPSKKVINNWQDREQMEGVIDNSTKLLKQYDKVIKKAQKYGLKVIKYDYTKETYLDVIAKL